MSVFFCPRCGNAGVQADGYTYCTRCRNQRQSEARKAKGVFTCPQCHHEGEKHALFKLCERCGTTKLEKRAEADLAPSREEKAQMKGFSALSQKFLLRKSR